MMVSGTKSACTACDGELGREIAAALADFGITYVPKAKSLGVGLGGGARRNTTVQSKRHRALAARVASFRRLRKLQIDTAKLLRTGGTAGITYDAAVTGVPPSTLLQFRRTCATIQAPASGCSGQDLDLALMMADGSATGMADPAFGAHLIPIGTWATAVWEEWLPIKLLDGSVADAKSKVIKAPRPWAVATGPATVFILTTARLGWTVHSATTMTTDDGTKLTLHLDPPAVVKEECKLSVQRWRWRNVQLKFPTLGKGNLGVGAEMPAYGACFDRRSNLGNGTTSSKVP